MELLSQDPCHSYLPEPRYLSVKYYRLSLTKMRNVSEYLGLAVPLLVAAYSAWVRHQRLLLDRLRQHVAATGKLTLRVSGGMFHVVRIEPLLKLILKREEIQYVEETKGGEECVECQVLHDPGPEGRRVDVIFIHGIKGALEKTWTQGRWNKERITKEKLHWRHHPKRKPQRSKRKKEIIYSNEKDEWTKCWPRDWLPHDCPDARIIAVNYTTDPYLWKPIWAPPSKSRSNMPERSWEMMNKLVDIGVGKHSIIWVGHSKGGLYVKQMLVNACESSDKRYRCLGEMTKGIQFYSVPHRGSPLASINFPILLKQSIEITELKKDCQEVITLHNKFRDLINGEQLRPHIKSFVETSLTLMSLIYVRVVSLDSADADIGELYGVPLDHRNICKPRDRDCFLYRELVELIQCFCEENDTLLNIMS